MTINNWDLSETSAAHEGAERRGLLSPAQISPNRKRREGGRPAEVTGQLDALKIDRCDYEGACYQAWL